ncbi:TIGR03086 family metal-binding protein [Streptomyces sp. NBC_00247]|uniref:TIGR03086 family metal-binding protein n=1 Tax=Streptomyces sp. NBC_00247 TaxID=2975689 RepID=UPI002E2D6748|nr:TIGR03086 family metal-binding protein [Streptomyces sp. NBC_00247]
MDIRQLDHQALLLTGEVISQVKTDHLRLATPCADWTLYGLVRHLVSQNAGVAASARGTGEPWAVWRAGDLRDDPAGAYEASVGEATAAFAEDDVLERRFALPEVGEGFAVPGRMAIGFHLLDYMAHAWGIAVTIGTAWETAAELTITALCVAALVPDETHGAGAALRVAALVPDEIHGAGAAFRQRIAVPHDAPQGDHLLALLGRDPSSTPVPC